MSKFRCRVERIRRHRDRTAPPDCVVRNDQLWAVGHEQRDPIALLDAEILQALLAAVDVEVAHELFEAPIAAADAGEVEKAAELLGADVVLEKPIKATELRETVSGLLPYCRTRRLMSPSRCPVANIQKPRSAKSRSTRPSASISSSTGCFREARATLIRRRASYSDICNT